MLVKCLHYEIACLLTGVLYLPGLKVVSYNVKEALADPRRSDAVLQFVEGLKPDIGVLHSAYWTRPDPGSPYREENSPVVKTAVRRLGELGYSVVCRDEADTTPRPDKTGFVGFVRATLGEASVLETGVRKGFFTIVADTKSGARLRIGGLHMTDTDEESRLEQVAGLSKLDVLLTDANAMHRSARIARILRAMRPLTDHVPDARGRDHNAVKGLGRVWANAHLLQRLVWMADGRTLKALETNGLRDADGSLCQPTIQKLGFGVAQLDHILYDSATTVVSGYQVHKEARASDHWPISASVRAKRPE